MWEFDKFWTNLRQTMTNIERFDSWMKDNTTPANDKVINAVRLFTFIGKGKTKEEALTSLLANMKKNCPKECVLKSTVTFSQKVDGTFDAWCKIQKYIGDEE